MAARDSAPAPGAQRSTERSTEDLELLDALTKKAAQLEAALASISDEGFRSFDGLNEALKQNYIWLCADLAKDVRTCAHALAVGPA